MKVSQGEVKLTLGPVLKEKQDLIDELTEKNKGLELKMIDN